MMNIEDIKVGNIYEWKDEDIDMICYIAAVNKTTWDDVILKDATDHRDVGHKESNRISQHFWFENSEVIYRHDEH